VSGDETGITYAPDGGYRANAGRLEGVTHGFQVGVAPRSSGNLQQDTDQLVAAFAQSNPQLRRQGNYSQERVGGRTGVKATLSNHSDITGQPEVISLATTRLSDGRLLYLVGVAPQRDGNTYNDVFRRVVQSVQLSDQ
jgi:hypothetical protein